MNSFINAIRFAGVAFAAVVLALGCDHEPPQPVTDEPPTVPADDLPSSVVPAATPPASGRAVPEMTSYEVAIAIAAANRRKAEADCDTRPIADRETCRTAVATEWDTTRTALEDLRGEQQ